RPVGLEGIELMAARETGGEDQLVHISRRDVLLRAPYTTEKVIAAEGRRRGRIATLAHAVGQGTPQGGDDLFSERAAFLLAAGMHESDAPGQVIEHQQRSWRDVVQRRDAAARASRQALEEAHYIVGRIPDEAAGQRYALDVRRRLRRTPQAVTQRAQQLRGRRGHRAAL